MINKGDIVVRIFLVFFKDNTIILKSLLICVCCLFFNNFFNYEILARDLIFNHQLISFHAPTVEQSSEHKNVGINLGKYLVNYVVDTLNNVKDNRDISDKQSISEMSGVALNMIKRKAQDYVVLHDEQIRTILDRQLLPTIIQVSTANLSDLSDLSEIMIGVSSVYSNQYWDHLAHSKTGSVSLNKTLRSDIKYHIYQSYYEHIAMQAFYSAFLYWVDDGCDYFDCSLEQPKQILRGLDPINQIVVIEAIKEIYSNIIVYDQDNAKQDNYFYLLKPMINVKRRLNGWFSQKQQSQNSVVEFGFGDLAIPSLDSLLLIFDQVLKDYL